jgi:flagellar hook-basal body complex protein FliE
MSVPVIPPIGAVGGLERLLPAGQVPAGAPAAGSTFAQSLVDGMDAVNRKVAAADAQVRAFAIDDSIPVHQVTFALEEARLSMELMMQVRARLLEGFQQLMGMQL